MKTIIYTLLLLCLFAGDLSAKSGKSATTIQKLLSSNYPLPPQESTPIFTINKNGVIIPNKRFISEDSISLPFSTDSIGYTSTSDTTYSIKTGRFKNWDNEPGDFDVIQFYKNNQLIFTYKDADGIVKWSNPENHYAYPFNQYSANGYYMEADLSASTKILIFLGQHYGTDLAKLIIFVVTPDEIKLVYNQKTAIVSIIKNNSQFSMVVQSNIPDEEEKAILHVIEMEKGILKFKNNND